MPSNNPGAEKLTLQRATGYQKALQQGSAKGKRSSNRIGATTTLKPA